MKRICLVSALAATLLGCGPMSSTELSEKVKFEMQRDLVKNADFSGLQLKKVVLVHQSGVKYTGVGDGTMKGVPVKFAVTCDYDGHNVLWNAELQDAITVYGKIKGKELTQKAGEAWSAAREKFRSGCDQTVAVADELRDEVKGFIKKVEKQMTPAATEAAPVAPSSPAPASPSTPASASTAK